MATLAESFLVRALELSRYPPLPLLRRGERAARLLLIGLRRPESVCVKSMLIRRPTSTTSPMPARTRRRRRRTSQMPRCAVPHRASVAADMTPRVPGSAHQCLRHGVSSSSATCCRNVCPAKAENMMVGAQLSVQASQQDATSCIACVFG